MAKFHVKLARLVRETRNVIVEAASREELEERLDEVYQLDDGSDYAPDFEWGCDEGTHLICDLVADDVPAEITLEANNELDAE